jgi:hypothetical protein
MFRTRLALRPDDYEGVGDRGAEPRADGGWIDSATSLAPERDQHDPRGGDGKRDQTDAAAAFRQQEWRQHREEDRSRVDGQDRDGDGGELQRLEEERPVESDKESEPDHLRAPPLDDEERQPPDDEHERWNGQSGNGAAPVDERSRRQVDARSDHRHETPRRRNPCDDEIPPIQPHMRSGASTPMRWRLRSMTSLAASQSASRKL